MMAARAAFVALCCAIGALGFAPSAHTARSPRGLVAQSAVDVSEAVTVTVEKPLGLVLEEIVPDEPQGVYVKMIDPQGAAAASGAIARGMRLVSAGGVDCTAASFDQAMDTLIDASSPIKLVFAPPAAAPAAASAAAPAVPSAAPAATEEFTIMASAAGGGWASVQATAGDNVRVALLNGGAELYGGMWAKAMNCNGGGQCGTCVVEVVDGEVSERTPVEDKLLKKKPSPNFRLACQARCVCVRLADSATIGGAELCVCARGFSDDCQGPHDRQNGRRVRWARRCRARYAPPTGAARARALE